MMMFQDQGDLIINSSDYLTGGFVDLYGYNVSLEGADDFYKVFLREIIASVEGREGNALVKISSNSKDEILEDWCDKKKLKNAAECDVIHEVHENVAGERVDADKSEMETDKEDFDPDYVLVCHNLKPCGKAYAVELARKNSIVVVKYEDTDDDEFHSPNEPRRNVPKSSHAGGNPPHTRRKLKIPDIVHRNSFKHQGRDAKRSQGNTTKYNSRSHRPTSRFADGPRWNGKQKAGDKEKNETPNHRRLSTRIPGELLGEDERCDDLQEGKSQRDGCSGDLNLIRKRGRPRKAERDKERVQTPHQPKTDEVYNKTTTTTQCKSRLGRGLGAQDAGTLFSKEMRGCVQSDPKTKGETKKRNMDKVYGCFLSQTKTVGECLVYTYEDGNECIYEDCTDDGLLLQMNVEGSAKLPSSSGRMMLEPSNKRLKSSDKRVPLDGMNLKAPSKPPPSCDRKRQEPSNKRLRSSDESFPSDQIIVVGSAKPPSSSGRMTTETSSKRLKLSMNVEASAKPPAFSGRKEQEPSNKRLQSSDERVPSDRMIVLAKPPSSSGRMTPETSNKRLKLSMNVEASAKPPAFSGRKEQESSSNKRLQSSDERVPSDRMIFVAKPPSSSGRMTLEASNKRHKSSAKKVPSDPMNVEGSISEYRKRAMEILLKPYDRKDHIDLLKEAKLHRPVMHHRDMRGRSISYPDEIRMDKSYLDRNYDLRKLIEAAQHNNDDHKVLHFLRGLFFYLQCTCMEDSFIPWKDKSWLEAVHKSTSK